MTTSYKSSARGIYIYSIVPVTTLAVLATYHVGSCAREPFFYYYYYKRRGEKLTGANGIIRLSLLLAIFCAGIPHIIAFLSRLWHQFRSSLKIRTSCINIRITIIISIIYFFQKLLKNDLSNFLCCGVNLLFFSILRFSLFSYKSTKVYTSYSDETRRKKRVHWRWRPPGQNKLQVLAWQAAAAVAEWRARAAFWWYGAAAAAVWRRKERL